MNKSKKILGAWRVAAAAACVVLIAAGLACRRAGGGDAPAPPPPFDPGTAIVVCGEKFDIGWPVVLWTDPIGFDAYSAECRFSDRVHPADAGAKAGADAVMRYGTRNPVGLDARTAERVRRKGFALEDLRKQVHQFVIHYDAVGSSERCFRALHDNRGLSAHFMLDLDGTIYQTLDVRERAFHAKDANDVSVGVEIANIGALSDPKALDAWYGKDSEGLVRNLFPEQARLGLQRRSDYVPRPARNEPVAGTIHGHRFVQYDFTKPQYDGLMRLSAGLSKALPRIRLEAPRDRSGKVPAKILPSAERAKFEGLIGHYHLDERKYDPGPAFDWDVVLAGARLFAQK